MSQDTTYHCRKEREIAEIQADLEIIKKVVMGNGQEGLVAIVPKLSLSVDTLNKNVETNNTLTSSVLRFKDELEGRAKAKKTFTERAEAMGRRNRWLIGIAVTLFLGLVGTLIPLLVKLFTTLSTMQAAAQ